GQVAELSDKYGPLHPKMARVKAELQDLREQIQHEVRKIYDSVKREYDMALARESAIKEAVSRYKKDKIKVGQYEIEHGILEREAQSTQHLYDIFLKVTKEADLSSGMRASNVYLADPAVPSSVPVRPKKKLDTMLGLLVGVMIGLAGALILEARDRSLKGPEDMERYLPSISLLGVVPLLPKASGSNGGVPMLSLHVPGLASESFRTLRTSLLFSSPGQLPSSVLITSPGESEGKTTLAVNLATALSQLEDTRVILIDGDLRKPNPHPIFEIETGNGRPKGLVDFLAGGASVQDILHQTVVPNLSVIPRGVCPPNPSELLHSKNMTRLLMGFRDKGYHVIVDAPPTLPVADPSVLAPQVDGVLLVVSAGQTTREACRLAVNRLKASGGNILGVVLQKARIADIPYYSKQYFNGSIH
nr:polysaccharide biosynthesis tyrosine autokinase [Nitrospira sp.]